MGQVYPRKMLGCRQRVSSCFLIPIAREAFWQLANSGVLSTTRTQLLASRHLFSAPETVGGISARKADVSTPFSRLPGIYRRKEGNLMFGHMKTQPILTMTPGSSVKEAIQSLIAATDGAQPVRWLEFPSAILLCLTVTTEPGSGAFYVLDRKRGTWLWVDFEDDAYGGYSVSDFDLLMREYDFLSLVERPSLLRTVCGWILEPGKPAEMAGNA